MKTHYIFPAGGRLKNTLFRAFFAFMLILPLFAYKAQNGYTEIIRQDTGTEYESLGNAFGGTEYYAHYFPGSQMQQYQGMLLHQIKFRIAANPIDIEARIYGQDTPTNPGELLFSKVLPVEGMHDKWVTVDLDTPIEITGEDIWIGYKVTNTPSTGPVGTDNGPANVGFGNMYSTNGTTWKTFPAFLNRNWNIVGVLKEPVTNGKDAAVKAIINPVSAANLSANEPITIQIKNYGNTALFGVPYKVNWADQQYIGNYNGFLSSDEEADITLPVTADLSQYGTYTFTACTNLPGDVKPELDCTTKTVENRVPNLCTENLYTYGCTYDRLTYWNLSNIELLGFECPTNNSAYIDYRTTYEHQLIPGQTYTLMVKAFDKDLYFDVWIDYNDNLEFTDNELAINDAHCEVKDTDYTFEFTVPENAPAGNHVMRLRSRFRLPVEDACTAYDLGMVVDFSANIVTDQLSASQALKNDISVYPVPASEIVNIRSYKKIKEIQIFDLSGKNLYNVKNLDKNHTTINTKKFPNGMYVIKIVDIDEKISTKKIIIKN